MDLDNIKNQVSNLTLYDLKAGFRKAQNAVMNYTEMESKVREATNNEPWGASTSAMQEIANGTFNYATLNEIMPMIYKRFTEKSAEEWRQIYKSLQLLEFLIKNGSERVIDDARSHVSLLKMLRQFHYIDHNGKDQGINVRNRAKELAELLSDVERIRAERKKARQNRNKYGGVEGGASMGGGGGSSRYGGFGSESAGYGGYSGGVYGDGGGFGGATTDYGDTSSRRDRFEEYDEYDEGSGSTPASSRRKAPSSATSAAKAAPPKPKAPEVDLFDFGDEPIVTPAAAPAANGKSTTQIDEFGALQSGAGDDDFDDFQSASSTTASIPAPIPPPMSSASTTSSTQYAQPKPMAATQASGMNNIFNTVSPPPPSSGTSGVNYAAFNVPLPQATQPAQQTPLMSPQSQAPRTTGYQQATPNYFGSIQAPSSTTASGATNPTTPQGATAMKPTTTTKTSSGSDPFASLNIGAAKKPAQSQKGPSMAEMAKQKSSAGIWGAPAPQQGSGSGGDLI